MHPVQQWPVPNKAVTGQTTFMIHMCWGVFERIKRDHGRASKA